VDHHALRDVPPDFPYVAFAPRRSTPASRRREAADSNPRVFELINPIVDLGADD
jgi:hypothetical protein